MDRAFTQTLLQAFFRAAAAAPNEELRAQVRELWEQTMAADTEAVTRTRDCMQRALFEYVVNG